MISGVSEIYDAHVRINSYIHNTPLIHSKEINKLCGCDIVFKADNLQKIGAFKARGACNAILSLDNTALDRGVITHSSGNHGAALSWAAQMKKISCIVVMPENASKVKIEAVKSYGGNVVFCEPTISAREMKVQELIDEYKYTFIHPFDDYSVIAGQGSIACELESQLQEPLDKLLIPVGGGGLISGISFFAKKNGGIASTIIGAEPETARDATDSFYSKTHVTDYKPMTIADGLRATLGVKNFELILKNVDEFITATESEIIEAMKIIWSRLKVIVEPSAAVPLAVILNKPEYFKNERVGVILSGGNLDLEDLPW